ncbi:MAG: hypothetical protein U9N41_06515 [Euryarchaeota archaeon]|nr:hypothetical protein [Euryarchaeota archaeon]
MAGHKIYRCIVEEVKSGTLKEPFTKDDFRTACPKFGEGTYNAFLDKHRVGNPGGNSELFERVSPGKFKLVRPFKYGFDC